VPAALNAEAGRSLEDVNTLAKALIFAVLQLGVLAGVPMTHEDVEKIMSVMHKTKIEHVVKQDDPDRPE
jgi:hypothetical protein